MDSCSQFRSSLASLRRHRFRRAAPLCLPMPTSKSFPFSTSQMMMRRAVRRIARLPSLLLKFPARQSLVRTPTNFIKQIRQVHMSLQMMSPLKRKADKDIVLPKLKKAKVVVPEYHLTPSRQDESGEIIWPARQKQIERAREIIKEW